MQQDCCFLGEVTDAVGLRYSRPLHVLRKEREKIVKSQSSVWRFSRNACMMDGFAPLSGRQLQKGSIEKHISPLPLAATK